MKVTRHYRVTWRRTTWAPSTYPNSRYFQTADAARAFVALLRSNGRPDLGPVTVRFESRVVHCEPWEAVK